MGGLDRKPGGGSLTAPAAHGPDAHVPGKRTRAEGIPTHAPVQRAPAHGVAGDSHAARAESGPRIEPPAPGIDKQGFIDNSKGAPLYNTPAEAGGELVRDAPLPPAARVFVSGTHPRLKHWWYVTAFVDGAMVRGYLEDFRVNVALPEPFAKLLQLEGGETPEGLARASFSDAVRDGHDLRYYENVLLYVNRGRDGIGGRFQEPNAIGRNNDNIKLYAGHRIWIVSPAFARSLEGVVPSGSFSGGAVAKARRFAQHLEDILASVTESPQHFGEVAGELAQAIRDHLPEIIGITAAFVTAEAGSMFLAATPTGVSQAAAAVIQLALAAFGAAGMVEAGIEALKHGNAWLTLAWTAHGRPAQISEASRELVRMLVAVAIAALNRAGAKASYRNALKIANNMPTGGLPAFATVGGAPAPGGGAGAGTAVAIGPTSGSFGAAGHAMMEANKDGGGSAEELTPKLPEGLDKRLARLARDVIQRARAGKLLKTGNYHPHFDDATVLNILKEADAIYQSEGKAGRLIFRKGHDIVIVEGPGSGQGSVVTGYGPRGLKGDSGAAALGGAAADAGAPITDAMITSGTVPVPKGRPPIPPATRIAP